MSPNDSTIYERPAELLQNLIRFDTTNPPGNEAECVEYVNRLLTGAGFDITILGRTPQRTNLLTRLKGRGDAPPLLLYGHVDVVTTANQDWVHPPFEGKLVDGYVWGRGALDMKGGVAMMLAALLRAKAVGLVPAGDIILAVLSDEEAGGLYGARYLVEEHDQQFQGVRYALGEFGGAPFYVGQKKFYAIQAAEKQICWLKATVRGPGGHASAPRRGAAMFRLSRLLQQLDQQRMPLHVTPVVRRMIEIMAESLPFPQNLLLRQLLNPRLSGRVLKLMGERGQLFGPMLKNTVSPTIVRGGEKINVIPSAIELEMDGRLLPGYSPDDMLAELRQFVDKEVEFELLHHDPGPGETDMGLFDLLADVLRQADPQGIPMPMMIPGVTDARFLARLGIQSYGFTPLDLPEGFNFFETVHAANERVPVAALEFGAEAIYQVLRRYQ